MDKKKLNNEIINCRSAVRKARVAVIRKIIKKMKILKTCKLEAVKEKKLRKSERLYEKIQILKKLKDDDVTEFALKNKDLEIFLKGPESDLKLNALASLARHEAVVKKVNSIREKFTDWEKELPIILDSLKKKREVVKNKKGISKPVRMKKGEVSQVAKNKTSRKSNLKVKPAKKKLQKQEPGSECEQSDDNGSVADDVLQTSERVEKIEKIEDPFFIEKKVIAPKLVLESLSSEKSNKPEFSRRSILKKDSKNQVLRGKPSQIKKDINKSRIQKSAPATEEETLHPSWAAKKVKLIKPFQGKKITFSDD